MSELAISVRLDSSIDSKEKASICLTTRNDCGELKQATSHIAADSSEANHENTLALVREYSQGTIKSKGT